MNHGHKKNIHGWIRAGAWIALVSFMLLNLLAYFHAGSFFYYADGGEKTPAPEHLTWKQKGAVLLKGIHVPKPRAHSSPVDFGLAYENVWVTGRGDLPLAGWLIPARTSGKTAILFHGYSSEKSGLLPEALAFHDLGYQVLLIDFFGSGESPGYMTSLGIWEAQDVAAVYGWVKETWPNDRVVLYGHSMGGAAVMRAMAKLGVHPDAAVIESVFDTLLHAIRHRFDLLGLPSFPMAEILLFWGSVRLGANGFTHDVTTYAAAITTPVLFIHGRQDQRASWESARLISDRVSGRSAFVLMDGAGHVNPCLSDPQGWRQAVQAFLESVRIGVEIDRLR